MTNRTPCLSAKVKSTVPTNVISYKNKGYSAPPEELDRVKQRVDGTIRRLLILELNKPKEAIGIPTSGRENKPVEDKAGSSVDSDKTLVRYPVVNSKEEICHKLFSPLGAVPNRETLQSVLAENPAVKIPIHHKFNCLQEHVKKDKLKGVFDIVEEVDNICPKLTPRVEAALHVNAPRDVTEGMQQCTLNAFLMGAIGTAQEYASIPVNTNRSAKEPLMTRGMSRLDYLLLFGNQLVFKGEEKKDGLVSYNAEQSTEKMKPGSVGRDGKLDYIIGYATSGPRILFECIYGDELVSECSEILNLERIADRMTLTLILISVIRVSRALYNSCYGGYLKVLLD